jgi:hypothetical protein
MTLYNNTYNYIYRGLSENGFTPKSSKLFIRSMDWIKGFFFRKAPYLMGKSMVSG